MHQKRIPDTIDSSLKKEHQILIIFGTNTPDTTGNQMTIQFPTSPSICFCTTLGKQNKQKNILDSRQYDYLIKITHFAQISVTLAESLSNCPVGQLLTVNTSPLWEHRHTDAFSNRWQQCRWCSAPDFNQSLLEFDIPKRRLVESLLHDTANVVIEQAARGHGSGEIKFIDVFCSF